MNWRTLPQPSAPLHIAKEGAASESHAPSAGGPPGQLPIPEGMGSQQYFSTHHLTIFWFGGLGVLKLQGLFTPAGMPKDALPQGPRKGRLSYTVTSTQAGAKIEVHLKGKAFRITKVGSHDGFLGWKPLSGVHVWAHKRIECIHTTTLCVHMCMFLLLAL